MVAIGRLFDVSTMKKIGCAEGSFLRIVGGFGIALGSRRLTLEIAACTSCAAASMLRSRLNWIVMLVDPWLLDEVIESTPGIPDKALSSGVATADAMVSGSAPGRLARTLIVGKSMFGSSLTGSMKYPNVSKITRAAMTRIVMTGRSTNRREMFIAAGRSRRRPAHSAVRRRPRRRCAPWLPG